jgi:glyoxylase-like metal-dependent hydrolase (beta-lactamase superfamily II)
MGIKTYSSRHTYDLCQQENNDQSEFYFTNDTTFHVGEYAVETYYPGEGHTKDNIVLWVDTHEVLYGGCLIKSTENTSLGFVGDANLEEWPRTMQRLIEKYSKPKYVIPGHFGWENNDGLEHTLKLLQEHK